MRHSYCIASALALALLLPASPAAALTIDAFQQAFPPNPCLPLSAQPVIFMGSYCDGAACPPAPLVSAATCGDAARVVIQAGLGGVIAGARREIRVMNWNDENTGARVDAASQRLRVSFAGATESGVGLAYGTPFASSQDPDALNLDLDALGVIGIRVLLEGDISPSQPLLVGVTLLTDGPVAPRPSAWVDIVVDQPGEVVIPLAAFTPLLGFTFADVDDIELWISNCTDSENGCPDPTLVPAEFAVGPLEFVMPPTPATKSSWGELKVRYR